MANPSGFYTCPKCGRLNAGAYTKCVCEQQSDLTKLGNK